MTSETWARRAVPIALSLGAAIVVAFLAFRSVEIRTDMADFIPSGRTDAAKFMLRELRSGAAATLILVGIEEAPPEELARLSSALADDTSRSGLFALVQNGRQAVSGGPDGDWLFRHRYLLSPVASAEAFTEPALRRDLETLLDRLQSSAAPLAAQYGFADPPGALLALAETWIPKSRVRTVGGVWFAGDRDRALLALKTRAGGTDVDTQERAVGAIRDAFARAGPGPARLLLAGPAVFTQDAARAIRSDVELLSAVSGILVCGLLLWRFRSGWVLAAIAVPGLLGLAAAALAVQVAFGFVHGVAFGFGMTMLGVTVDYPVLLIGHRKRGEEAEGTLLRIGETFRLAVVAAVLGLTGMAFSSFPIVSQLGVFSAVGVLAAALATRFVLPRLIVAADLAPVSAGDPAGLLRVERVRRWRAWSLVPVALAGAILVVRPPRLENDLRNLSPVPQAARDLDAALRSDLGAPDVGQILIVTGGSAEAVLQRQETLKPVIDDLRNAGAIGGAEFAARYLPSVALQTARRASLPDTETLNRQLATARAGLPFREDAFSAFVKDVAATRAMAPLVPADLASPLLAARLEPFLFERDGGWFGPVALRDAKDLPKVAAAFANLEDVVYASIQAEANGVVVASTDQALIWLGIGALAAVAALTYGLRDWARVGQVVGAVASAGLVTLATLSALGVSLSLIHIVSLQFVAGVGLDYALFFARRQLDEEERARTLRTLVTCNAMTLMTFGLLATCRTPVLRDIGFTVAVGALTAMAFSFFLAGERLVVDTGDLASPKHRDAK